MAGTSENNPISPIKNHYWNSCNSTNISEGFITSTEKSFESQLNDFDGKLNAARVLTQLYPKKLSPQLVPEVIRINPESSQPGLFRPKRHIFKENRYNPSAVPVTTPIPEELRISPEKTCHPIMNDSQPVLLENYHNPCAVPVTTPSSQYVASVIHNQDNLNEQLFEKVDEINNEIKRLESKLDKIQNDHEIHRAAQNKLLIENLVIVKKIHSGLGKFIGPDDGSIEMETIFPVKTIAELSDVELRLGDETFASRINSYLRRLKGTSSLESVFRFLATDTVYHEFNLEGRAGKRSLNSLKLFKNVLFDACGGIVGKENYQKELRKCVLHAHNRFFKKK